MGSFPNGFSDTPLGGFPTSGPNFTILTNGDSQLADDANSANLSGSTNGVRGTGALAGAFDYTILSVPITATRQARCVGFDFRFLSEEYPEYVGAEYIDTFLAELDQRTWAVSGSVDHLGDRFRRRRRRPDLGRHLRAFGNVGCEIRRDHL